MMQYNTNPRLALLIPRGSFVYRGAGSVARGILNWAIRNNYSVDVISDQPYRPNDMFKPYIGRFKWIYSSDFDVDPIHRDLNTYNRIIDTELVTRIRNSLVKAIESYSYGAVITNTAECLMAATSIGLHTTNTLCHITLNETEAGLTGKDLSHQQFANGIGDIWRSQCALDGVRLLTPSDWLTQHTRNFYNHKQQQVETFPWFLADDKIQVEPQQRYGIGTIGPVEPRKANDKFIDFCKQMGQTARMLAPTKVSAEKFEERCAKAGVKCQASYSLQGYEKRKWIASLALAYHPSFSETFGLGVFETAEYTPTILRADRGWSQAHEKYCFIVDEDNLVEVGQNLYGKPVAEEHRNNWHKRNAQAEQQWHSLVKRSANPINTTWNKQLQDKKLIAVKDLGLADRRLASITQDTVIKMARLALNHDVEHLNTVSEQWVRPVGTDIKPTNEIVDGSFESLFELADA